jgi:hypothetical protein
MSNSLFVLFIYFIYFCLFSDRNYFTYFTLPFFLPQCLGAVAGAVAPGTPVAAAAAAVRNRPGRR